LWSAVQTKHEVRSEHEYAARHPAQSDMVNLMRAKDAALSVALSIIRRWQADVTATEGP
jgi:hypothetical protein